MLFRVKKLEWVKCHGEDVAAIPGGSIAVGETYWLVNQRKPIEAESRDAAKLAAEAWYHERLMEVVTPSLPPSPNPPPTDPVA